MAPADKKGNRKIAQGKKKSKRKVKKVDMETNQPLKINWELAEKTRARKRNREKQKLWKEKRQK